MVIYLSYLKGSVMSQILTPFSNAIRHTARAAAKRLALVTREEFDVQTQVLLKTRQRVEQLEKQLLELIKDS
jgi:BMFP domain-containing protein YqiC